MEFFIYYRVPATEADATATNLSALQAEATRRWPPLQCRALRRADTPAEAPAGQPPLDTWMETYAWRGTDWPQEALRDLLALLQDQPPGRVGPRHVERFLPVAG